MLARSTSCRDYRVRIEITQAENLLFLNQVRELMNQYPDCTSVGEISDDKPLTTMARYTSGGDKLQMAYTFDLLAKEFTPDYVRSVIRRIEESIDDGWPCWAASNHDVVRHNTRWNNGVDLGKDGCRTPIPWNETPNAAARSLRTGKTGIIGVMLSNYLIYSFSDPVAHEFLSGLAEVFEEREHNLLVMPSRDHVEMASGYESFVDGFIVYGPPQPQKLAQLVAQHKSIITVDFEIDGYVSVNLDNFQGARKCAEHALRHIKDDQEIAVLGLRINDQNHICRVDDGQIFAKSTITIQRLLGFQSAAAKARLRITARNTWHIPDNKHELGYQAAKQVLSAPEPPKLLLCMSDRIAMAALQAAKHSGLRVPEDVLVTGFDDIPESRRQHPTPTTVYQQSKDKGQVAAAIFLGLREEKNRVLPTELVIRESCP